MNQELLIKDACLAFALACIAAGSPLLASEKYIAGLVLYAMAGLLIGYRTYLKTKETQPKLKK